MSRYEDDDIIIGGGDEVDEMERAGRMISETAQLIDEIPVIEEDDSEPLDFSEEITIGGDDDEDEDDDSDEEYEEESDEEDDSDDDDDDDSDESDEEEDITIGDDDEDDDSDDDEEEDEDESDDDSDDDDSDDDDSDDSDDEDEYEDDDEDEDEDDDDDSDDSITFGEPEEKTGRTLRSKRTRAAGGAPVALVGPRDLTAVRAAKAKKKEQLAAAKANGYEDDGDFKREYLITASPHLHCGETTRLIMQDVIFALIPAALAAIAYYGLGAALTIAVCVASCVLSEYICRRVMKRPQTIGDYSAVVTGILLAFCLPPEINPLFAAIGSIVAIVVVKQMFGGIGMNFANPAATARIVLMLSFPVAMTTWSRPFYYLGELYDAVSTATPLAAFNDPTVQPTTIRELFFGFHAGSLGEGCAVMLLVGGLFLLIRGVISWHIPVGFIGTVMLFALIAGQDPLYHVLSGGVMLGAFFMATDYVTSPSTKWGKLIFGIGCGLLTMLIRLYGSMAEGVSFAILLMNILSPHIEKLTTVKPYGEERGTV